MRVEAKGSSPKKSSPWRVTNAHDGSQHSCHLRRRPIRHNPHLRREPAQPDDLLETSIAATDDLEPIDLTYQLASAKPYQRFRRYDGFDNTLHQSPTRKSPW